MLPNAILNTNIFTQLLIFDMIIPGRVGSSTVASTSTPECLGVELHVLLVSTWAVFMCVPPAVNW